MATPKEIKNRISAVQNTKKITKTMEMVATAKSKRAVDRVNQSLIYSKKLRGVTQNITSASINLEHPLLRQCDSVNRIGILVLSGNRGLCGGFNNNTIKMALQRIETLRSQNIEVEARLVGKKAISSFRFLCIPFEKGYTHIEDKPTYEEASEFAEIFMTAFEHGEIDRFEVISTRYLTSATQSPKITELLPFEIHSEENKEETAETSKGNSRDQSSPSSFLFEPSAEKILSSLLPRSVRVMVFQLLLESAASEQIARRVAMKNATENATEIIRDLTLIYNRVRQAKITQEIAELVGGAAAIE